MNADYPSIFTSTFTTAYLITLAVLLVASFLLAIIPSRIAKRKGYSGVGFYWFGFAAFIPAVIVASCLRDKNAAPKEQAQEYRQDDQYRSPDSEAGNNDDTIVF